MNQCVRTPTSNRKIKDAKIADTVFVHAVLPIRVSLLQQYSDYNNSNKKQEVKERTIIKKR